MRVGLAIGPVSSGRATPSGSPSTWPAGRPRSPTRAPSWSHPSCGPSCEDHPDVQLQEHAAAVPEEHRPGAALGAAPRRRCPQHDPRGHRRASRARCASCSGTSSPPASSATTSATTPTRASALTAPAELGGSQQAVVAVLGDAPVGVEAVVEQVGGQASGAHRRHDGVFDGEILTVDHHVCAPHPHRAAHRPPPVFRGLHRRGSGSTCIGQPDAFCGRSGQRRPWRSATGRARSAPSKARSARPRRSSSQP